MFIRYVLIAVVCGLQISCTTTVDPAFRGIYSWGEADQLFKNMEPGDLVLFDVDEVLVHSEDNTIRYKHMRDRPTREIQYRLLKDLPEDQKDKIISAVIMQSKREIIEKEGPGIIATLRKKGVRVYALTKAKTGRFGMVPSVQDWRYKELKGFGIDFNDGRLPDHTFTEFAEHKKSYPVFYKGILATHNQTKGDVLRAFLKWSGLRPRRVYFFDDRVDNLQSVGEALQSMGVPFTGIQYKRSDILVGPLDLKLAECQFQHVTKTLKWLPDKVAKTVC